MRKSILKQKHIIVVILSTIIYSQSDSLDYLNFYPIHIGDVWQYAEPYSNGSIDTIFYYTSQIVGDTIMPNGIPYFIKERNRSNSVDIQYLRIDTTLAEVFEYSYVFCANNDFNLYPLMTYHDSVSYWYNCMNIPYTVSFIDSSTMVVVHEFLGSIEEWTFSKGIGVTNYYYESDASGNIYLIASIINGVQNGNFVNTEYSEIIPTLFQLKQNYPNPFNSTTTIIFQLNKSGFIEIAIYDINSHLVDILVSGKKDAGIYQYKWEAHNLATGIYFAILRSDEIRHTKKLILVK